MVVVHGSSDKRLGRLSNLDSCCIGCGGGGVGDGTLYYWEGRSEPDKQSRQESSSGCWSMAFQCHYLCGDHHG